MNQSPGPIERFDKQQSVINAEDPKANIRVEQNKFATGQPLKTHVVFEAVSIQQQPDAARALWSFSDNHQLQGLHGCEGLARPMFARVKTWPDDAATAEALGTSA